MLHRIRLAMQQGSFDKLSGEVEADETYTFERFEEATKRLFQVSKKDVDKADLRAKKEREAREADHEK